MKPLIQRSTVEGNNMSFGEYERTKSTKGIKRAYMGVRICILALH
jgi:hypothetical protein